MRMGRGLGLGLLAGLLIIACGGNGVSDSDAGSLEGGSGEESSAGGVVDVQPAGQAHVSVDGEEFTFDTPGLTACNVESDTFTFSFVLGDNQVGLAGGANLYDDGWLGDITVRVIRDNLPYQYYPDEGGLDSSLAIDGDSISYSGPMLMRPPNDGSNPPAESVGDGTISVTCG